MRKSERRATAFDRLVGERLRDLRITRGISLASLAARIGVREQQISKYEVGQDRISATMLYLFSFVLRVSVDELCRRPPHAGAKRATRARHDVSGVPQTKETIQMVRYAAALPSKTRRLIAIFELASKL